MSYRDSYLDRMEVEHEGVMVRPCKSSWKIRVYGNLGKLGRNMFFSPDKAEHAIHYGLMRLRHDTPDGPGILPMKLRREDTFQNLKRLQGRRFLHIDYDAAGLPPKAAEGARILLDRQAMTYDIWFRRVVDNGWWQLAPAAERALQALKKFLLNPAAPFHGMFPAQSIADEPLNEEQARELQEHFQSYGLDVKLYNLPARPASGFGLTGPHIVVSYPPDAYWLRQMYRLDEAMNHIEML
jgi:hypothetical protein